ncbi:RseA family anti-sigma factor [Alteromonas sp. LMIT006]|jgi:sigma-E factor negative regulatory protein RseA|uniref:sigma-E factor negative regulatory protein n=1 Tax=Alteromonadaceae TaxID=72275 RepID=UPI0020CA80D6|nr:RseA family anti-sigma factor [Alteromonas sp. LMIT006]UTP71674.1 RseA family anti-sigma factor [Alteromonas sp. LMIT006]
MGNKQEQLSALVDGQMQATDSLTLDDVYSDDMMLQKWQRYHTIGDVMRGESVTVADNSLLDRIADALDDEPTVLAPRSKRKTLKDNVVTLFKQSSQFAVAAGVAAVMILGVQNYNQTDVQPFMTAPTSGPQGALAPVSLSQTRNIANPDRQAVVEQRKRINALLVDHKQQLQRNTVSDETEEPEQQP